MITWIASYPRSGNTGLRTILWRAFGIHTHSIYDDPGDIGSRASLRDAVGHTNHGFDPEQFYAVASSSSEKFFVKTHDAPRDDAKAIYIIRDGRSSSVSFFHYLKSFQVSCWGEKLLTDVIIGDCPFGSWSSHYESWSPLKRPNTLLLRYDDLANNPLQVAKYLAEFIEEPIINTALPTFEELHKTDPNFFRVGSDSANIAEFESDKHAADLFWFLHGDLMFELNYISAIPELSAPFIISRKIRTWQSHLQRNLDRCIAELGHVSQERDSLISKLEAAVKKTDADLRRAIKKNEEQLVDLQTRDRLIADLSTSIKNMDEDLVRIKRDLNRLTETRWFKLGRKLGIIPSLPD